MAAVGVLLMAQLAPTYAAAAPVHVVSSGTPEVDQSQSPNGAHNGHPGKVVFHRTRGQAGFATSGGNMTYHGGPTERQTSLNYAIFWQPTGSYMSLNYQSLIGRYFDDIGLSGLYNNNTQYYDGSGNIVNSSSFGGGWVDTSPYPSGTLSDTDIQNEVVNALNQPINAGWQWTNPDSEYFVFTAKGENSCIGRSCSFTQYCAYHSNVTLTDGVTTTPVRYANMPYTGTNLAACGVSTSPNNDFDADSTINVTSHEHMETVTDPLGSAWYDGTGSEIGDKCSWNFGSVGLDGGLANEEWNGHYYIVQQEWSNAASGCVLSYGSNTSPSYSIAPSPSSLTAAAGGAAVTSNLVLTSTNGFSSNGVNLTVSGAPAGVSATVASPSTAISSTSAGSSTLTVQASSSAASGSYTLTLTGDGATPAPTAKVTLNVANPTATFSLNPNTQQTVSLTRGSSSQIIYTLSSVNGFNSSVSMSISNLSPGVTASWSPSSTVSWASGTSQSVTLRLTANRNARNASRTLTVTASGGGVSQTDTIALTVSASSTKSGPAGDTTDTTTASDTNAAPGSSASSPASTPEATPAARTK